VTDNSFHSLRFYLLGYLSFVVCCALLFILLFGTTDSHAQQSDNFIRWTEEQAATANPTDTNVSTPGIDIRLLVDISGSMKKNDPQNLRQPAVRLLNQVLPPDSKAGIWTFGRYVNNIVPSGMTDEAWRKNALAKTSAISSDGLFTHIGLALETAVQDLKVEGASQPSHKPLVILLTDGMVDIDKDPELNQQEQSRIFNEVLPFFQEKKIPIYSVALSEKADTNLLERLSRSTNGMIKQARSAEELAALFMEIINQAAPPEQVPLSGNQFFIDSSIEEFTLLLFTQESEEITLSSPDGTRYQASTQDNDLQWHQDKGYTLITIQRPFEGEWQIASSDPDSTNSSNQVTIISNMSLWVKPLNNNYYSGDIPLLQFALRDENDKVINDQDFLQVIFPTVRITHQESGMRWVEDVNHNQGTYQYSLDMLTEPGNYQIDIEIDGKSFQRKWNRSLSLMDPVAIEINYAGEASTEATITLTSYLSQLSPLNSEAEITITSSDGTQRKNKVSSTPDNQWRYQFKPPFAGDYQVSFTLTGEDKEGKPLTYVTADKTLSFDSQNLPQKKVEEEPIEELVEEEPEQTEKTMPEEQEDSSEEDMMEEAEATPWWIYLVIGLGNVFLIVAGFFTYKILLKPSKTEQELELEMQKDSSSEGDEDKDEEEPEEKEEKAPEPEPEPEPKKEAPPEEPEASNTEEPPAAGAEDDIQSIGDKAADEGSSTEAENPAEEADDAGEPAEPVESAKEESNDGDDETEKEVSEAGPPETDSKTEETDSSDDDEPAPEIIDNQGPPPDSPDGDKADGDKADGDKAEGETAEEENKEEKDEKEKKADDDKA